MSTVHTFHGQGNPFADLAHQSLQSPLTDTPEAKLLASNQLLRNVQRRTLEGQAITPAEMKAEGYTRVVAFWVNKNLSSGTLKVAEMAINGTSDRLRLLRTNNEFSVRRQPSWSDSQTSTFQQTEAWFRNDRDRDNFVRDVLTNPAFKKQFTTGTSWNRNLSSFSDWSAAAAAGALNATGQVMYQIFKSLNSGSGNLVPAGL